MALDSWLSTDYMIDCLKREIGVCIPKVIIELGTFTGRATEAMAKFVPSYSKEEVIIYTFDLGAPYAGADEESNFDLVQIRKSRLNFPYSLCKIVYIEGWTKDTLLPALENTIHQWDFCFHDSGHQPDQQIRDFQTLEPFSRVGSIILFDDADNNFINILPDYIKDRWVMKVLPDPHRPTKIVVIRRLI